MTGRTPRSSNGADPLPVDGWFGVVLIGAAVAVMVGSPVVYGLSHRRLPDHFEMFDMAVMGVFGAAFLAQTTRWRRTARQDRRRAAGQCGRCGYDLRGSDGPCPECGAGRPDDVNG